MTTQQYHGSPERISSDGSGPAEKLRSIHQNVGSANAAALTNLPANGNKAPGKEGTCDTQAPDTSSSANLGGYFGG